MRVFVALILLFFFTLAPPACSFHCVKIYVTRGCVGFLYSISTLRCKYCCVALIVTEIIYFIRNAAMYACFAVAAARKHRVRENEHTLSTLEMS